MPACKSVRWVAFAALALVVPLVARAGDEDRYVGRWEGVIRLPGQELPCDFDILPGGGPGALRGDISIPMQGLKDLPLTEFSVEDGVISFRLPAVPGNAMFTGGLSDDGLSLSGELAQSGMKFPFEMKRAKPPAETAAETLADLDAAAETIRATWDVPGFSIAVVKDDRVALAKGYGERDREGGLPVTPRTLFAIGSCTKAFTTFVMGALADEGKLDWNRPVIESLPDFRLHDETATRLITPLDLVTHRSGLPRHDALWYNSGLTRREMYERLRYLEPNESFRGAWQYNNLMFLAAGCLVERLTGATWEAAVAERIFKPLGMTRSNFSVQECASDPDRALPYAERNDALKRIDYRDISAVGPAGSINSCAEDLAAWLLVHLNDGKHAGREVIRPSTLAMLHTPAVALPPGAEEAATGIINIGYAPGWFVDVYRGHKRLHHGGVIDGFSAMIALFPNDRLGVAVLANRGGAPLPELMVRAAADRVLGLESRDWSREAKAKVDAAKALAKEGEAKRGETRVPGAPPSRPFAEFAGDYVHPAYGAVRVEAAADGLTITYNSFAAPFEHWHYDVFVAGEAESEVLAKGAKAQFLMNTRGEIDRLELPLEPAVKPIVFKRAPDAALSDPVFLEKLAGEYELGPAVLTISVRHGSLRLFVPGQPEYELEPLRNNTYRIKTLDGYFVRFLFGEDGAVKEMQADQPNGLFTAKPRRK